MTPAGDECLTHERLLVDGVIHCDLRGCGAEVGQVDAISRSSAVRFVEQSSSVERLKKGHLRGNCRHAKKNPSLGKRKLIRRG